MRYAFAFDAAACTGCKACQMACKDKNQLPAGVLWRRVYEVAGGGWHAAGAGWTNTVFAYNVSVACNHCADPACMPACPAGAYSARIDGIVSLDSSKCIGCEYCAWACPYGAPQYSPALGRTTKCDFCRDLIDAGLPPACVAACPMRALDLVRVETSVPAALVPFPLPEPSRTRPQIAIAPHRAMTSTLAKAVANREEVRPRPEATLGGAPVAEMPLVAFSLLAQAAAGTSVVAAIAGLQSAALFAMTGVLLLAACLVSLLHLGTAARAWRAPANLRRSPLSREVALLALFAAAWAVTPFVPAAFGRVALAACGVALVDAMARVYRIDAVPPWNTWRTHAAFAFSALLLGGACTALVILRPPAWAWATLLLLLAPLIRGRSRFYAAVHAKPM